MHSFTAGEHEFRLSVTVTSIRTVREVAKIDLLELLAGEPDNPIAALTRFVADDANLLRLVDAVYVLCREQCRDKQLSDAQFGELLAGSSIESMRRAFALAVIDFFPDAPLRESLRSLLEAETERQQAKARLILVGVQEAIAKRRITPEQMERLEASARSAVSRRLRKINAQRRRGSATSNDAGSNSPDSSALTPAPSAGPTSKRWRKGGGKKRGPTPAA